MNFKLTNEFIHQVQNLIHDKSDTQNKIHAIVFSQDLAEIFQHLA